VGEADGAEDVGAEDVGAEDVGAEDVGAADVVGVLVVVGVGSSVRMVVGPAVDDGAVVVGSAVSVGVAVSSASAAGANAPAVASRPMVSAAVRVAFLRPTIAKELRVIFDTSCCHPPSIGGIHHGCCYVQSTCELATRSVLIFGTRSSASPVAGGTGGVGEVCGAPRGRPVAWGRMARMSAGPPR
jgi:hypothetical protein